MNFPGAPLNGPALEGFISLPSGIAPALGPSAVLNGPFLEGWTFSEPAEPVGHRNIVAAIIAKVRETPELIDLMPGGFAYGTPPEGANDNPPYGVLLNLASPYQGNSRGRTLRQDEWQVSFVGPDDEGQLEVILNQWQKVFNQRTTLDVANELFRGWYDGSVFRDPNAFKNTPFGENFGQIVLRATSVSSVIPPSERN